MEANSDSIPPRGLLADGDAVDQEERAQLAQLRTQVERVTDAEQRRVLHDQIETLEMRICAHVVQRLLAAGVSKAAIARAVPTSWRTIHRLLRGEGTTNPAVRHLILRSAAHLAHARGASAEA